MTPGARVAAAIELLDEILAGCPAEQALTRWARRSRFAGSKDRAAVRDHVFEVLRIRRLAAHLGGAADGRGLMIGLLRHQGLDPERVFDGSGHAPAPLSKEERAVPLAEPSRGTAWNLPEWLVSEFETSLGAQAAQAALALQHRAPIFLRVNTARVSRENAAEVLLQDSVHTQAAARASSGLKVTEGARRIRNSRAFAAGLIELQDASSQAIAADLPAAGRVLDYCAGGGGKALALAAEPGRTVFAHDAEPTRMADIPERAARAGARIDILAKDALADEAPFGVVLCDAPCSGSGAWRRAPAAKWAFTSERLQELTRIQDSILDAAAPLVAETGVLVYATCSVLRAENEARVTAFLARHKGWRQVRERRFPIDQDGDGFFVAHLTREAGSR